MSNDPHATGSRAAICFHRHRRTMWEGPLPGMGNLTLTCDVCGATASAPYNTPLPDLPPMPKDENDG